MGTPVDRGTLVSCTHTLTCTQTTSDPLGSWLLPKSFLPPKVFRACESLIPFHTHTLFQLSPGRQEHNPPADMCRWSWTAHHKNALCIITASPSWGQPVGLDSFLPSPQNHSCYPSTSGPSTPERGKEIDQHPSPLVYQVSLSLCPTCCHLPVQVVCLSSSWLQPWPVPERQEGGAWSILCTPPPNFQLPLQLPPSSSRPLGKPLPLSCLPSTVSLL